MSSPTSASILAASMSADLPLPAAPTHAIRRPSTFLSLAPTTSASYPSRPSPPASIASPKMTAVDGPPAVVAAAAAAHPISEAAGVTTAGATTVAAPLTIEDLKPIHRRSSSLASDESGGGAGKLRFLKLGPVHWGEGDGKGDWSEVVGE